MVHGREVRVRVVLRILSDSYQLADKYEISFGTIHEAIFQSGNHLE